MIRAGLVLLAVALLTGCVPTSQIQPVSSMAEVTADEVVIIGKIELDPPLQSDEQKLGSSYEEYRNTAMVVTDTEVRDAGLFGYGDLGRRIDASLGKFFIVKAPAESFYLLRSWIVMRAEVGTEAPAYAPLDGLFKVDIRQGDKVVYIGSLTYTRDEFFRTRKVTLADETEEARAELARRFGGGVLRRALVQPVEQ